MKFRTEIKIEASHFQINYEDPVGFIGSCFTENIGNRLKELHFLTDINPFGVVYNPLSVMRSLELLIQQKQYSSEDLEFRDEKYFSWDHHSDFSGTKKDIVLDRINQKLKTSSAFLKNAKFLFISLGTAWVYRLKKTGDIVCNCHKVPSKEFDRELLSIEKIGEDCENLITDLKKFNPELKIIFTISPVRHWKDGAHGNQISKSILQLAVKRIIDSCGEGCDYFPSYEIMIDDLRDYRFYADDLLHPNQQAIDYIWEKFSNRYFNDSTIYYINKIEKLVKASQHRFYDSESKSSAEFREKQAVKLKEIRKDLPFLNWSELSRTFGMKDE